MNEPFSIDYKQLADAIVLRLSQDIAVRIEWVHIDKVAELLGITKHVIKGWFDNHLTRGVHYKVIGHQTLVNTRRLNEWLDGFGTEQTVLAPLSRPTPKSTIAYKVRLPVRSPKS